MIEGKRARGLRPPLHAWPLLLLLCIASGCLGPGLEPPGDEGKSGIGAGDEGPFAGDDPVASGGQSSGGSMSTGGAGSAGDGDNAANGDGDGSAIGDGDGDDVGDDDAGVGP